jgi:enoyl-[acyl-carrier protein] reductase I
MGCMDGKTGLVVGVANDRSYAWFIAQSIIREGGTCLFTHLPGEKMERRVRKAIDALGIQDPWLRPMDASSDESMDELFGQLSSEHEQLDYLVHSIAFADREWLKEGKFTPTPREVFKQAMDISAWTYAGMAHRISPMMTDGGGMVSMSYYGAEKAVPGYNVMGVAKAALEATTRYLAMELGEKNIRVNSISGGPIRTMSSMAVGGFSQILDWVEQKSPLRRNVTGDDVGDTAAWLCSPRASGITGQTIYVDCGYSSMGL